MYSAPPTFNPVIVCKIFATAASYSVAVDQSGTKLARPALASKSEYPRGDCRKPPHRNRRTLGDSRWEQAPARISWRISGVHAERLNGAVHVSDVKGGLGDGATFCRLCWRRGADQPVFRKPQRRGDATKLRRISILAILDVSNLVDRQSAR